MASCANQCILLCLSIMCLLFCRNRRRSCRISPIEQITAEMYQLHAQLPHHPPLLPLPLPQPQPLPLPLPQPQPLPQLQPLPQPQPPAILSTENWKLVLVKEDEESLEYIIEMVGDEEKYADANGNKFNGRNAKTGHQERASAKKSGKLMKNLEMEPHVIVNNECITFVFNEDEDEELDESRFDPRPGQSVGYDTHGSLLGQGYKGIGKF